MFMMLLREGFAHRRGKNNGVTAYAREIKCILNNYILSGDDGSAQWVLLMDKDKKQNNNMLEY